MGRHRPDAETARPRCGGAYIRLRSRPGMIARREHAVTLHQDASTASTTTSGWPSNIRSRAARRSWRARPVLGIDHTVVDRLLLLLEQILEDELAPDAAACVHQRATLVELSQLDGWEPELFGQGRHGGGRVLVVARQEHAPVAALYERAWARRGPDQGLEPCC